MEKIYIYFLNKFEYFLQNYKGHFLVSFDYYIIVRYVRADVKNAGSTLYTTADSKFLYYSFFATSCICTTARHFFFPLSSQREYTVNTYNWATHRKIYYTPLFPFFFLQSTACLCSEIFSTTLIRLYCEFSAANFVRFCLADFVRNEVPT